MEAASMAAVVATTKPLTGRARTAVIKARPAVTKWRAAEAIEVFGALSALAEQFGFRLSMLGSVFEKGEGKDLDLLLTPFGSIESREAEFLAAFGGRLLDYRCNVERNIKGYMVEKNGRLYDFILGNFWSPRRNR